MRKTDAQRCWVTFFQCHPAHKRQSHRLTDSEPTVLTENSEKPKSEKILSPKKA